MKKNISVKVILLLAFCFSLLPAKSQNDFEIAKNVDIFVSILKELNSKYADEVNPSDLTKVAIDAMLNSLDPYTIYYPESQIEDFRLMTTGQYGGIGAIIQQHETGIVISEPYEDSPAALAGLRAGDRIIKINNQSIAGKSSDEVSTFLKGEPGTSLTIEIERPGSDKNQTFNVARKEIKLPNIPYYGMLDNHIGYIKLDQFTENAGNEVKAAFQKLKEEGMNYLILDLRNNGGGLLHEAVNIMNIFVDQNTLIASTKGKIKEQSNSFRTRMPVLDKSIPVVVLVNEYSASASEIVAGAFQDLDRGIVVGKKTFGKGLVQNVVPLSYNSSLKITVSKYYIPSGRCVQNVEYFVKDSLTPTAEIPDSLAISYKTKNGRIVYDKGGIYPDIITKDTMISNLLITLVMNNHIFDFANQYYHTHSTISPAHQFVVDNNIYKEFTDFLEGKEYGYTTDSEHILADLKKSAQEEHLFETIEPLYNEIKAKIKNEKTNELQKFKEEIASYLASEIATRYYYQKGRIISLLASDLDVIEAKKILRDSSKYKSILSNKK